MYYQNAKPIKEFYKKQETLYGIDPNIADIYLTLVDKTMYNGNAHFLYTDDDGELFESVVTFND